jgi:hypothetical protein
MYVYVGGVLDINTQINVFNKYLYVGSIIDVDTQMRVCIYSSINMYVCVWAV